MPESNSTEILILVGLTVLNLPLMFVARRLFFSDWSDFFDAIRLWITPDLWSLANDELWEDWRAEFKLGLYSALCAGMVAGEFLLLTPLIVKFI